MPTQVPQGNLVLPASEWPGVTYVPPVPNDLKTAELAIVNQLKENIANGVAEVAGFPSDWEHYRLVHQNGAVLVRFMGAEYDRRQTLPLVAQRRTMEWAMVCVARELGWTYGGVGDQFTSAYGLIEMVRLALTGFQMTGFDKAFPIREDFLGYKEGVWGYEARYAFITTAVEQAAQATFPLFTTGTFLERGGQTLIAVPTAGYSFVGTPGTIVLGQQNVSSVVVSNQSTGAVYTAGSDYTIDTVNGIITRVASGSILVNATVNISLNYADVVTELASGGTAPTWPTN